MLNSIQARDALSTVTMPFGTWQMQCCASTPRVYYTSTQARYLIALVDYLELTGSFSVWTTKIRILLTVEDKVSPGLVHVPV